MSSADEPEDVILREGDEYDALRHDYLQGLYEKIVFTGDLDALAAFIREGGDIEQIDFREIIPDLIEANPKTTFYIIAALLVLRGGNRKVGEFGLSGRDRPHSRPPRTQMPRFSN